MQRRIRATITNFANSGTAQAWQLTSGNVITRLADVPYANGVLSNTFRPRASPCSFCRRPKISGCGSAPTPRPDQMEFGWMGRADSVTSFSRPPICGLVGGQHQHVFEQLLPILVGTTNSARMFYRGLLNSP